MVLATPVAKQRSERKGVGDREFNVHFHLHKVKFASVNDSTCVNILDTYRQSCKDSYVRFVRRVPTGFGPSFLHKARGLLVSLSSSARPLQLLYVSGRCRQVVPHGLWASAVLVHTLRMQLRRACYGDNPGGYIDHPESASRLPCVLAGASGLHGGT